MESPLLCRQHHIRLMLLPLVFSCQLPAVVCRAFDILLRVSAVKCSRESKDIKSQKSQKASMKGAQSVSIRPPKK